MVNLFSSAEYAWVKVLLRADLRFSNIFPSTQIDPMVPNRIIALRNEAFSTVNVVAAKNRSRGK
jgi:hypothetical protein